MIPAKIVLSFDCTEEYLNWISVQFIQMLQEMSQYPSKEVTNLRVQVLKVGAGLKDERLN